MKRTLIKQNQSYTITLPKKWIEQHNLQPGQEIELNDQEGDLVITTKVQAEKKKSFKLEQFNKSLVRSLISSAYKAGYTEITLSFTSIPSFNEIYPIANSFTGMEVVSQTKKSITLKSFLSSNKEEVENLILKLFQIGTHIAKNINEDWNKVNLADLLLLKQNAIKIRDHTLRMIHASTYGGDKSYDYYDFVTQLEKIIAELSVIAEYISVTKPAKNNTVTHLISSLELMYSAYLKKEYNVSQSVWTNVQQQQKQLSLPKKHKEELSLRCYALANSYLHLSSRLLSLTSEISR